MLQRPTPTQAGTPATCASNHLMTLAEFSALALKASLPAIVFGTGLATSRGDVIWLFKNPGLWLRSLLSMNVIAPLFAIALVTTLPLAPPVKIALVMLSVSPVPPVLPRKQAKAGGEPLYIISLLATSAALSIVVIPVTLELLQRVLGVPLGISPSIVARQIGTTVLVPLALGIASRAATTRSTKVDTVSHYIVTMSLILLLIGVLPMLLTALPAFRTLVGDGTLMIMVSFAVGALITGHLLGGPNRSHRTVLALSTATRHPGIAISLAAANFPDQKLAVPAVLMYVIVSAAVSAPYVAASRRHHATPVERSAPTRRISETPSRQR